jgi:glycosyltransferase involved in cell wall biosynthesis
MDLGLCMIVKDEENRIDGCLRDIVDLFEDIVIIDTGSTDRTRDILATRYGINPIVRELEPGLFEEHDVRNFASSLVRAPFIMTLDADERIERGALQRLLRSKHNPDSPVYFCAWNTYRLNKIVHDYKGVIFRKGMRMIGEPHGNFQYDLRQQNMIGSWIHYLTLHHYPERRKMILKMRGRMKTMLQAIEKEPQWYRHYWFLGYTLFQQGKFDSALEYLAKVSASFSPMFPVECLNSKMIMATIYAGRGERVKAEKIIYDALDFYKQSEQDFEVRFNTRMKPWFETALSQCENDRLAQISAYEFSY